MSNSYLCAACKHHDRRKPCPRMVGAYACELHGVVRGLVIGDGMEPREVCKDYEDEEDGDER